VAIDVLGIDVGDDAWSNAVEIALLMVGTFICDDSPEVPSPSFIRILSATSTSAPAPFRCATFIVVVHEKMMTTLAVKLMSC
jgi:hypothetical protein